MSPRPRTRRRPFRSPPLGRPFRSPSLERPFRSPPLGRLVMAALALITGTALGCSSGNSTDQVDAGRAVTTAPGTAVPVAAIAGKPHAVFVDTRLGDEFGRVSLADLATPSAPFALTGLQCDRVDMAGDRGTCLQADRATVTTYKLLVFDRDYHVLFSKDLNGLPSRTRVSPDGSRGAVTIFVTGDSYGSNRFSTRTEIWDLRTEASLGNLEQYAAQKDGQPFTGTDFNYWGVTFAADGNRFYATLGTGGDTYLVQGDVDKRQVTVLRDAVECPSLSPDGARIAFKKRVTSEAGRAQWQLSVLDVATLTDHPLAETRNVDDQAAWLDADTVTYGVSEADSGTPTKNTFAVPADGSGAPRELVAGAWSLEVARP